MRMDRAKGSTAASPSLTAPWSRLLPHSQATIRAGGEAGASLSAGCAWGGQLSVVAAIQMPPNGGGVDVLELVSTDESNRTALARRLMTHLPGRMVISESRRMHTGSGWAPQDTDAPAKEGLRMIMHGMLVPCSMDGSYRDLEFYLVGLQGGG